MRSNVKNYWQRWLTRIVVLAFVMVAGAGVLHLNKWTPQKTAPEVYFSPSLFDFGVIPQSVAVEHSFKLVNRGTNDLTIVMVRASCSCTVAAKNLVDLLLPAGTNIFVPVKFNSGERQGKTQSDLTMVLSSRNANYAVQARIRCYVDPEFIADSRSVDFGFVYPGRCVTQQVIVRPNRVSTPPLLSVSTNIGCFHVQVIQRADVDSEKSNSIVTVAFTAPLVEHREVFGHQLKLASSSQTVADVGIDLKALVVPSVEVTPDTIVMGTGDESLETRFMVRTREVSQISRVVVRSADGRRKEAMWREDVRGFGLMHNIVIPNRELFGHSAMEVETGSKPDASGTEARFASVEIKSLIQR